MNSDSEVDAVIVRNARVALDHRVLHFDGAAHRVDHAPELDQRAVARALEHPSVMGRDGWVDEFDAERPKPRQRAILVRAGQPTDTPPRRPPGSPLVSKVCGHPAPPAVRKLAQIT